MLEYYEVLSRKKFKFDLDKISYLLLAIEKFGILVSPAPTHETLPDIDDLPFYEVVIDRRDDDAYLVTGNIKHFPNKPFIVTARQMLSIIETKNHK